MFTTTFLGHQGWMIRTDKTCILVDPLLRPTWGEDQCLGSSIFPPREMNVAQFPAVHAVILSHEHDDHVDVGTLNMLDRRTPVFLSARASTSTFGLLKAMGFSPRPLVAGVALLFHDLEFLPLAPDHVSEDLSDEWDTVAFLARDTGGDGSLFSYIDVSMTPRHLEIARARVPKPGLVTYTNNAQDWSFQKTWAPPLQDHTPMFIQKMMQWTGHVVGQWGIPEALLLAGGGFAFDGDRAELNHLVFPVDNDRVQTAMAAASPDIPCHHPRPGWTWRMKNGALVEQHLEQPWLKTRDPALWPSRAHLTGDASVGKHALPYAPGAGRKELDKAEWETLGVKLKDVAQGLYGGMVFRGLYSLYAGDVQGRAPTMAIAVHSRSMDQAVYAYDPSACTFQRVEEVDPEARFLAGMHCWARDLLAVLQGDVGPTALGWGRVRFWNHAPKVFEFGLMKEVYALYHPLRRVDAYKTMYARMLEKEPAPAAHIPFAAL